MQGYLPHGTEMVLAPAPPKQRRMRQVHTKSYEHWPLRKTTEFAGRRLHFALVKVLASEILLPVLMLVNEKGQGNYPSAAKTCTPRAGMHGDAYAVVRKKVRA